MHQNITANPGPVVVRGFRGAIGSAIDLGGPGASRWTNSVYDDPAPNGDRFLSGSTIGMVSQDPWDVLAARRATTELAALCEPDDEPSDPDGEPWEWASDVQAFVLEIESPTIACSTFTMGGLSDAEIEAELLRRHSLTMWPLLERAVWTAVAAATDTVVLTEPGERVLPGVGVAELESWFVARRPEQRGLIMAPGGFGSMVRDQGVYINDRGITFDGNHAAFLPGVPVGEAAGPDGPAAMADGCMSWWMFIMSRLQLRLGTPYIKQGVGGLAAGVGVDYATNDATFTVRQPFAVAWWGPAGAVQVGVCSASADCPVIEPEEPEEPEEPVDPEDPEEGGV